MTYQFQCIIMKRNIDKPCTVRLIDGGDAEEVDHATDGAVYQLQSDGSRSLIARLQYTHSFSTEDVWTKILYSGGCLTNHEYDDAPTPPYDTYYLPGYREAFTLYPNHGDAGGELRYEGKKYPIVAETCDHYGEYGIWKQISSLTVGRPDSQSASPLARIVCTDRTENRQVYDIRMEYVPSPLLCVAICSLAFYMF